MSLILENGSSLSESPAMKFIDEGAKSMMLRNEQFEMYNSFVEIGNEHYLFGLGFCAEQIVVKDWNVSHRITA